MTNLYKMIRHPILYYYSIKKIALQSASPGSMPLSNKLNTSINIQGFNTQAAGIFPGISSADIAIVAGQNAGHARVTLGPQEVSFNGQFDRAMPVQKADFNMSWTQDDTGLQLSSDKSILVTDDLESLTQFSLFLPVSSEQDSSPFLSLYSTVSLNDANGVLDEYQIVGQNGVTATKDELAKQFDTVATTAEKYNITKDPASCSGGHSEDGIKDRLKHLF